MKAKRIDWIPGNEEEERNIVEGKDGIGLDG
jgi:hypothetical protein